MGILIHPLPGLAWDDSGSNPAPAVAGSLVVQISPAGPISLNAGSPALLTTQVGAAASGGAAPYAYSWSRTSGTTSTISDPSSASPTIGATVNWGDNFTETWTVTATDVDGASGSSSVTVNFASPSADGVPDAANRVPIAGTISQYTLTTALPVGQSTYPIQVYVPADYSSTSDSLPVIYACDGGPGWGFSDMVRTIEAQNLRVAMVGIGGFSTRGIDYLEPGAQSFYTFISTEMIPFVESRYRIDPTSRTLTGHSYGGLFVGLVFMMERPATRLFSNYISMDGSFWVTPFYNVVMEQALYQATSGALPNTELVLSCATGGNAFAVLPYYQQLAALNFTGLQLDLVPTFNTGHLLMFDEAFAASLRLVSPNLPRQPSSQTVAVGNSAVFRFRGPGPAPSTYQWAFNGKAVAGATQATLVISGATPADAGTYTCTATNALISTTSTPATLAVVDAPNPGRLVNVSCRATVGSGSDVLIAGFAVGGTGASGSQSVLIRSSGPALIPFGVTGALSDPQLELHDSRSLLSTNNGWAGDSRIAAAAASAGAFPWTDASSHDSALVESLAAGPYSAVVSGAGGDTGDALAEVYDVTPPETLTRSTPRLVNLSARAQVGTGGNVLIVGFVIGGSTSRTVLIRAAGPALARFGVGGILADPQLRLHDTSNALAIASGWGGDAQIAAAAAAAGAFSWTDATSLDSALLVTLPPGAYTAEVVGASGDTGVALVEIYDLQ